jgi:hypothetical protein
VALCSVDVGQKTRPGGAPLTGLPALVRKWDEVVAGDAVELDAGGAQEDETLVLRALPTSRCCHHNCPIHTSCGSNRDAGMKSISRTAAAKPHERLAVSGK